MESKSKGIKRLKEALKNSYNGFVSVFFSEEAFRLELLVFIILTFLAIFFVKNYGNIILLVGSLFLVLVAELVNTAIEVIIDRISNEVHFLSKLAKDIGSLIVLCAIIFAIFVWSIVLWHEWIGPSVG